MSLTVVRLQNLPWSASAPDVRKFFNGLEIPSGGVHIVGGENGDCFVVFKDDDHARKALRQDGRDLNGVRVSLSASSAEEMQYVIAVAKGEINLVDPPSSRKRSRSPSPFDNKRKPTQREDFQTANRTDRSYDNAPTGMFAGRSYDDNFHENHNQLWDNSRGRGERPSENRGSDTNLNPERRRVEPSSDFYPDSQSFHLVTENRVRTEAPVSRFSAPLLDVGQNIERARGSFDAKSDHMTNRLQERIADGPTTGMRPGQPSVVPNTDQSNRFGGNWQRQNVSKEPYRGDAEMGRQPNNTFTNQGNAFRGQAPRGGPFVDRTIEPQQPAKPSGPFVDQSQAGLSPVGRGGYGDRWPNQSERADPSRVRSDQMNHMELVRDQPFQDRNRSQFGQPARGDQGRIRAEDPPPMDNIRSLTDKPLRGERGSNRLELPPPLSTGFDGRTGGSGRRTMELDVASDVAPRDRDMQSMPRGFGGQFTQDDSRPRLLPGPQTGSRTLLPTPPDLPEMHLERMKAPGLPGLASAPPAGGPGKAPAMRVVQVTDPCAIITQLPADVTYKQLRGLFATHNLIPENIVILWPVRDEPTVAYALFDDVNSTVMGLNELSGMKVSGCMIKLEPCSMDSYRSALEQSKSVRHRPHASMSDTSQNAPSGHSTNMRDQMGPSFGGWNKPEAGNYGSNLKHNMGPSDHDFRGQKLDKNLNTMMTPESGSMQWREGQPKTFPNQLNIGMVHPLGSQIGRNAHQSAPMSPFNNNDTQLNRRGSQPMDDNRMFSGPMYGQEDAPPIDGNGQFEGQGWVPNSRDSFNRNGRPHWGGVQEDRFAQKQPIDRRPSVERLRRNADDKRRSPPFRRRSLERGSDSRTSSSSGSRQYGDRDDRSRRRDNSRNSPHKRSPDRSRRDRDRSPRRDSTKDGKEPLLQSPGSVITKSLPKSEPAKQDENVKDSKRLHDAHRVEPTNGNGGEPNLSGSPSAANKQSTSGGSVWCVVMSGLPSKATKQDIVNFLKDFKYVEESLYIEYDAQQFCSGTAYVQLVSEAEQKALLGTKKQLLRQSLHITQVTREKMTQYIEDHKQKMASFNPSDSGKQEYIIAMNGVPFDTTESTIKNFLHPVDVNEKFIRILRMQDGRCSGTAFVKLFSAKDRDDALRHDRGYIGKRYIQLKIVSENEMKDHVTAHEAKSVSNNGPPHNAVNSADTNLTLVLSNLRYDVKEEQIEAFFREYQPVKGSVRFIMNNGMPAGRASIRFSSLENMKKASDKDGHDFAGRPIRVTHL